MRARTKAGRMTKARRCSAVLPRHFDDPTDTLPILATVPREPTRTGRGIPASYATVNPPARLAGTEADEIPTDPHVLATDGASRGNPGPAAIGYAVLDPDGRVLFEDAATIGRATNNEAEYRALIAGLEELALVHDGPVLHLSDSQLVVRQLTGAYSIRADHLADLADRAGTLSDGFARVDHEHVPREDDRIERVDALANDALDAGDKLK